MSFSITDQFTGGNIKVEAICGDHVELRINNRDSRPWFYWAFKVCGASGRQITFHFGKDVVGYFGAAVSYDLEEWHWSDMELPHINPEERFGFTYTFGEDEEEVYFAHNMLYNPERFQKIDFMKKSVLCVDSDGSDIPLATMGDGDRSILLTARHHACEAPANYVLEGVLKAFYQRMPAGYRIMAVPFVDMAGVVAGDQGKGRLPHDHNRDYGTESIYPSVDAIKKILSTKNVKYVFDFHSPLHIGGGDDYTRLVNAYESMKNSMERLSALYEDEITEVCFDFRDGRNTWRDHPQEGTLSAYSGSLDSVAFVATVEMPYFGEPNNRMSQERYIATGEAFGRAIRRFIEER